ncbi:cyclin-dependent kinase inhibitor 1C-like [Cydia strobilella]|uniref:cyclin-dependent kinase inhibitor 1C-like n=1 Tax=Cydia strobilella TaxID=1100964 RepID=UPI003006B293
MAARRLVLNGLTAEVEGEGVGVVVGGEGQSPDSLEFYHELELYRQLLALPAEPRRARTPDPRPTKSPEPTPPRRSRTPCARVSASASAPAPVSSPASAPAATPVYTPAPAPAPATTPRAATPAPATGHTRPAQGP